MNMLNDLKLVNLTSKPKHNLQLSTENAFRILKKWAKTLETTHLSIIFDASYPIGSGMALDDKRTDQHNIIVGIDTISQKFPFNQFLINDIDFIRMGVTLFHEYTHYNQNINGNTDPHIIISNISKYGNAHYYTTYWNTLPHEIDADYIGTMTMWAKMEQKFSKDADACMLEYVNMRANQTIYMIPKMNYYSKKQVKDAFQQAYENSLKHVRPFQSNFLQSDDEISHLLTNQGILRSEYQNHYKLLISNIPGEQKDRLMASLVFHLHPELKDQYPSHILLNPEKEFGFSMPETPIQSQLRVIPELFVSDLEILSNSTSLVL